VLKISHTIICAAMLSMVSLILFPPHALEARECTRHAFSVNDYGIEVPKRDAQLLLDKAVAEWAAERGIKNYTIGEKTVTCRLFLDLIIFDEHTCRAEADVCW
jgi:hypothetical protein